MNLQMTVNSLLLRLKGVNICIVNIRVLLSPSVLAVAWTWDVQIPHSGKMGLATLLFWLVGWLVGHCVKQGGCRS